MSRPVIPPPDPRGGTDRPPAPPTGSSVQHTKATREVALHEAIKMLQPSAPSWHLGLSKLTEDALEVAAKFEAYLNRGVK